MTTDREALLALLTALNASPKGLGRDGCGDWRINGGAGHIYADGDAFLLWIGAASVRGWTSAKKRLAFCRVTQDGDDEGCLYLDRLPDKGEAAEIRAVLGIRKRTEYSPETLAARRAWAADQNGLSSAPVRSPEGGR